jgi:hypothetical protein
VPAAGSLLVYFCRRIPHIILLVFVLVSAARENDFYFKFNRLWYWTIAGQGHHAENTNINNSLSYWFDSIFLGEFSETR